MIPDSPFGPFAPRESFLETLAVGAALARLIEGLGAREPFLLVTGDPGTGKTAVAHEAIDRWGSRVTTAFLAYPALTAPELLEEILVRFGAASPEGSSRSKLIACIERAVAEAASRSQVAVIVVDDAHELPRELLEELLLLVNAAHQARKPIEVMLVGLPALEARLDDAELASLRQRISVHVRLEPLSPEDTVRYLHHRIAVAGGDGPALFPRETCLEIAGMTGGVPRRINALASEALRMARGPGKFSVMPDHVKLAVAALRGTAPTRAGEKPMESKPARPIESMPIEPKPVAPAPVESRPIDARPVEPKPFMVTPVESRPVVAAPVEPRPIAATPPAAKPIAPASEPKPIAATPPAPKAPEPKPVEAKPAAPKPAPEPPIMPAVAEAPRPIPTAPQDQKAWVARFVGDKGPLQIGSRVESQPTWAAEAVEPGEPKALAETHSVRPPGIPKPERPPVPWHESPTVRMGIVAGMAVTVLVVVIMLIVQVSSRSGAGRIAAVTAGVVADSTHATAPRGSRSSERKTSPARATMNSRGPFTIEVGSYSELQTALDQRDRVQSLTGIQSWVVLAPDDGSMPNRIVVGMFSSHSRAEGAANMLLRSKTMSEAVVIPMPSKSQRQ